MIAIAIAVANSIQHVSLTGAINSARAFAAWASQQGYETIVVTDEKSDVTFDVLREKMKNILKGSPDEKPVPIHRIIVYFAGHGLIRELEQGLWLLSGWQEELRAVAVEVLKRRLTMYGPKQICIIADACRSLPSTIEQEDLAPDPILGAGPKQVDLTVAIDKFIAAQDGTAAFMIPGANPADDRCLFSGVLVEGLWGLSGPLSHEPPFSKLVPDMITSRSLGSYLQAEVAARAKTYGLTLAPSISPTFPEGDDCYFSKDPTLKIPTFSAWPPPGNIGAEAKQAVASRSGSEDEIRIPGGDGLPQFDAGKDEIIEFGTTIEDVEIVFELAPRKEASLLIERLRTLSSLTEPLLGQYISGLAVSGADSLRFWFGRAGPIAQRIDQAGSTWKIQNIGSSTLDDPAPALVEFPDKRFAAIVLLPYLFTSVALDDHGVAGLVYQDLLAPPHVGEITVEALEALESGSLRGDAATNMATQLRVWKHVDPVLGVISAYLYDAIGDTESILRMASFYAGYGEAIPYDIALLGGLSGFMTERGFLVDVPAVKQRQPRTQMELEKSWTHCATTATQGLVGGLWPWMRQGWAFLDDPSDVESTLILPGLAKLRSGLTRSRFTTFNEEAALKLANFCNLRPNNEG
jgi:hypothetical protein